MRGRKPDMSRDAAAALRMVLGHIIESQKLFQARQEAGQALDKNRQKVVEDICNAGPKAISGKALTQRELERVDSKHKLIVDVMVSEVASQLQGRSSNKKPSTLEEKQVWAAAALYLSQRVQGVPEQMPGREPDMNADASKALCTALGRIEAGCKLDANREKVVQDIINPAPLTQTHLGRVDAKYRTTVDAMVREVSACLGGKTPMSKPSSPEEVKVWGAAARYLSKRVQGTPEDMKGRKPDMSRAASAQLCVILREIAL